jgi:transposase InsO family protein
VSVATSPTTGRSYGVERVCAAWAVPRSTFYAHKRQREAPPTAPPEKRGPRTEITDAALLDAIRADLARSPFRGEGHRKVWARLRVLDEIRVARKRVLRVMREARLLSPHRVPQGDRHAHEGVITTDAPNVMWGTDGARVLTVDDGYVWLFIAAEHWNFECMGWHVAKLGDRFAALEPVAQGVKRIYGSLEQGAARGLSVRMDHGTQYLSDHFAKQLKFWGITPSYAFVEEPQTNGVAERFLGIVREQVLNGRIFRNIEEVRHAMAEFVERFNGQWIVEKLNFLSPAAARSSRALAEAA